MGLRGRKMRFRFATVELFPKRESWEANESGTRLVRISPKTGGAGRGLLAKLLGGAGGAAESPDRGEEGTERDPGRARPSGPQVEDPLDRR